MNIPPVPQHGSLQSLFGQSSSSINTEQQELLLANYNLPGLRIDGRMSAVRRFFCLFVTFDLLFTSVFWIICVLIDGQSIEEGLKKEILNYTYSTSMFDLVVCSLIRFVLLLLFYALIHIHHYWIVAITTMLSSAFFVAKSLIYQWNGGSNTTSNSTSYPFQVLLLLISFLLTWAEAWLIDFNVLPQEARAKNLIRALMSGGPGSVTGQQQDRTSRLRDYLSQCTVESVANFYSPLQSPYESEDEDCEAHYPKLSQQENVWQCLGVEAVLRAYDLLRTPGWNRHSQPNATDFIAVRTSTAGRNIYKITAPLQAPAELLYRDVVEEVEKMPSWNPAVLTVKKIQPLSASADVVHQISADVPGGIVKSRDFVMVRHWRRIQGGPLDDWTTCWISGGLSITHPKVPVLSQYIRGENGPGCWAFCERATAGGRTSECIFHWVLETDLKGWVPRAMVDKAISGVMVQQVNALRQRAASLLKLQTVHYPTLSDNDDPLLEELGGTASSDQPSAASGDASDNRNGTNDDDSLLC